MFDQSVQPGCSIILMDESFLERLEQKAEHHAREAERYRIAAEVLREEMRGVRGVRATRSDGRVNESTSGDPRQNTKAMVLRALDQSARPLHPTQLAEEMIRLGWQTNAENRVNTVRTAALRLTEEGRVQRVGSEYARLGLPPAEGGDRVVAPGQGDSYGPPLGTTDAMIADTGSPIDP